MPAGRECPDDAAWTSTVVYYVMRRRKCALPVPRAVEVLSLCEVVAGIEVFVLVHAQTSAICIIGDRRGPSVRRRWQIAVSTLHVQLLN